MDFIIGQNRIFTRDSGGKLLAEITFPPGEDGVHDINHTFVDESLRGQGVADGLMRAAVRQIRQAGAKARPTCRYAKHWFDKNADEADILV